MPHSPPDLEKHRRCVRHLPALVSLHHPAGGFLQDLLAPTGQGSLLRNGDKIRWPRGYQQDLGKSALEVLPPVGRGGDRLSARSGPSFRLFVAARNRNSNRKYLCCCL